MYSHHVLIAVAASLAACQSLELPTDGSSIQKRQGSFQSFLAETNITDGMLFNIVFDGAHFCDSNLLGPLWGKDNVVKDFTGGDYFRELSGAPGPQRAVMVAKNFGAALPSTDNENCAQGSAGQEGFTLSPIERETLGRLTLRVGFIGPGDDLLSKFNISIETGLPPVLGPPAVVIARNVAAAGIAVVRWLLLDVVNWLEGRDAFPARLALALSVMGRVIQTAVDAWNGIILGECPPQEQMTDALSQINLAKPLSDKPMYIAPADDVSKLIATAPIRCIPQDFELST